MLPEQVMDAARSEIANRFAARDKVLVRDLQTLSAGAQIEAKTERLGIDVRIAAERDMFERAAIVFSALRRCYRDRGKGRYPALGPDLLIGMSTFMTEAGVNLAAYLRDYQSDLAAVFSGANPIDAGWLKTLKGRAIDRHARDIDRFVRTGR